VLRTLTNVIRACLKQKKPVTLCGEMAGQPRAFVLLLGMGLRSFSMSPAFIPTVKQLAAVLDRATVEEILKAALRRRSTSRVQKYMSEQLHRLAPNLEMLDTVN
jgi:phosphotransferase system enzyme I (PtsI)